MRIVQLLVAMSQPMQRVRLRALGGQVGLAVVAEAATASQATQLAAEFNPDLILCDAQILNDPATALFCRQRRADNISRFVLVSPGAAAPADPTTVPVSGVLAASLSPGAMRQRLLDIYSTPLKQRNSRGQVEQQPKDVSGLADRFMIVPQQSSQSAQAAPGDTKTLGELDAARAAPEAPSVAAGRRRRSPPRDRLERMLADAKVEVRQSGERDAVTGLPTAKVMGRAMQALNEAGCPSAILVLRLWSANTMSLDRQTVNGALRSTSGALQANVRHGDIVCRLDDLTFAAVMPGLEPQQDPQPIARIRRAIDGILEGHRADGLEIRLATGSGYWSPPMNPNEAFEQAWKNMLESRRGRGTAPTAM